MMGTGVIQRRTNNRSLHGKANWSRSSPFRGAEKRQIFQMEKSVWVKTWRKGKPKAVRGSEQNNLAKVKGLSKEKWRDRS